ncbi:NAD(P)/FAD-dependent oxidoreductase [Pseudoclavibacter sp. CFCC 14310]|uniref:NAD(P)/FAD-dependent oxidoreductase n=1 Tax=Pseudoclavibacter sp. CFCC 14310 TaxID=2615180 RepID=UPI0013015C88|nr:NAD(P)/FAD-dependent oxidoreductase [Pseudoclavibacter sp. CFCC 14310]KAB1647386.1 NAD(P)/FAD-dependent oxidoreductase [Pseudoclavibacter sp. CFCC 14310]
MTKILIIGGGYAGFYTARTLEKLLNPGEAEVTLVDARPYMTYQPFLPEVAAGSIEPRHVLVPHRRHLSRTNLINAKVTAISNADKQVTVQAEGGAPYELDYDVLVVTLGAVSRTFPIPGIAENAIGLKSVEEAEWIRNKITTNFDRAANLPVGPERQRLLTFVVVGGGFAGIEGFAEVRGLATKLLKFYPQISESELEFHLIEAADRIMPEVSLETAKWVIDDLKNRHATIHLETQVTSAVDGIVETSKGDKYPTDVIIWTAGQMANPVLRNSDLPLEPRGRLRLRADLRAETDDGVLENVWGAGDSTQVPDVTGNGLPFDGSCVPNAQHAVRQAKRLGKNIVASLRGDAPIDYVHKPAGAVAGLGVGNGVFTGGQKKFSLKGFPAWVFHRGYHGLAIPMWERKFRVFGDWWHQMWIGRDLATTSHGVEPRAFFEEFASRPRPKPAEAEKPAESKAADKAADAKPADAKPADKAAAK